MVAGTSFYPWGWLALAMVAIGALGAGIAVRYGRRRRRELVRACIEMTRLRQILAQMPVIVWTVDAQFRWATMEGGDVEHLGNPPQDMLGKTIYEYFKTSDRAFQPVAAHEDAIISGRSTVFEIDWNHRTFEVHVAPLRDGGGGIIGAVGAALDITQRKRAEQALLRSEQRAQAILTAIPDVMFRIRGDGTLVEFIDKLAAPAEARAGKHVRDLFPADVAQLLQERTRRTLANGQMSVFEYQMGGNGQDTPRFFEARLVTCGPEEALVILRNMSERKRAEQDLAHREAEMRSLIRAIPDLILVFTPDGRMTGCVAENDDILLPPDQFLGRRMRDVLPAHAAEPLMECLERAVATQEPQVCQYRLAIRGDERRFEARLVFVGQGHEQVMALIRNITHLREKG